MEQRRVVLLEYFFCCYLIVLLNASGYLKTIQYVGSYTSFFTVIAYLVYCFLYLLPLLLLVFLLHGLFSWSPLEKLLHKIRLSPTIVLYAIAVAGATIVNILIFADKTIFQMYSFHINGFVLNLIFSPGGIEALGGNKMAFLYFFLFLFVCFFLQSLPLLLTLYWKRFQRALLFVTTKKAFVVSICLFLLGFLGQMFIYGVSQFRGYTPVLAASASFPAYIPVTFQGFAKRLGFKPVEKTAFRLKLNETLLLKYPLNPIQKDTNAKRYNVVVLVAECWRHDMVDPEIMPATWNFAQKSSWFKNHYSGGNGTRMGLFSLFYGIYGNYWFPFLEENRGPVLMDYFVDENYQIELFDSQRFGYPEFDKTVFARISRDKMHEEEGLGWERDRKNIQKILKFIDSRDPSRPFMTFMFFESTHARYYFPPECAIRKPYLEDFNYATVDIKANIGLIKNRYINSCYHLDSQIELVLKCLEKNGILDSTIVVITGDHGQEFMEKGYWGHNAFFFHEEQVRAPLILWIPGRQPQVVTKMTSHFDVAPTLLPVLGIKNPPEDYSHGFDLFGSKSRDFTVFSSWDDIGYMDEEYKVIMPLNMAAVVRQKVTTRDDAEVADPSLFYKTRQAKLVQVLKELGRFSKK